LIINDLTTPQTLICISISSLVFKLLLLITYTKVSYLYTSPTYWEVIGKCVELDVKLYSLTLVTRCSKRFVNYDVYIYMYVLCIFVCSQR